MNADIESGMHAPLGALGPSQTHVEHADPIPTVPNYFTRELECPWVSISVHHSYRHHPRTPCSVWYPQPEIALGRKLKWGRAANLTPRSAIVVRRGGERAVRRGGGGGGGSCGAVVTCGRGC